KKKKKKKKKKLFRVGIYAKFHIWNGISSSAVRRSIAKSKGICPVFRLFCFEYCLQFGKSYKEYIIRTLSLLLLLLLLIISDKNLKKWKNEAAKWRKETSDAAGNVIKSRQKSSGKEPGIKLVDSNNRGGTLLQLLSKNKSVPDKTKTSQDADYLKARNVEKQFQMAVNKYNLELKKLERVLYFDTFMYCTGFAMFYV
ncbi:hypothetical protein RFI_33339, partial [Reticulomyxa filosa]